MGRPEVRLFPSQVSVTPNPLWYLPKYLSAGDSYWSDTSVSC